MASVQTMQAERAVEQAANEEKVHDIRAALFVIRGAAEMLHQHCNELDSETVTTLAQALASEVAQVQSLTSARTPQPLQAVRLRDVLDPLILCEAQARTRVTSDIHDVLALGRPAEVVSGVQAPLFLAPPIEYKMPFGPTRRALPNLAFARQRNFPFGVSAQRFAPLSPAGGSA